MTVQRFMSRSLVIMGCLTIANSMIGCAGGVNIGGTNRMSLSSRVNPETFLASDFNTAIYNYTDDNHVDLLLIDGSPDDPNLVVHLEMFWSPNAGYTPVDRRGTNSTLRFVVFTGQGVGVYRGAGFVYPKSKPKDGTLKGELRDTTLRLVDASDSFRDPLEIARAIGVFNAERDDVATRQLLGRIERMVGEELGYPVLVNDTDRQDQVAAR